LEKFITVTVWTDDEEQEPETLRLFYSRLPVFYIDLDDGAVVKSKTEYVSGDLTIQGNDIYHQSEQLYTGRIQLKGRGNSTWNNTGKKSYHLKLEEDADLFGMGAENDWVMLANPFDQTLMRNALSYNLSGKLGLYYVESTWVDVVFNGEYVGNYQLCEKIEISPARIHITSWKTLAKEVADVLVKEDPSLKKDKSLLKEALKEDLSWISTGEFVFQGKTYIIPSSVKIPSATGGFVLELDMFYDEISKFTVGNQQFMFKDPTYALTDEDLFQYTQEYITAFYVAAMSSEDFYTVYHEETVHYSDLFDMDSLAAYFLIQEIFFNEDGTAKSTYMYKDVDDVAYMGPVWDMDWSSAGEGEHSELYDQWQVIFYSNYNQNHQWYKGLVKDPYFLSRVKKFWDQYRDEIYEMVAEGGDIDQIYEYIAESGTANGELWIYRINGFSAEVDVLRTWLTNRLNWLDAQFTDLQTLVDSIGSLEYGIPVEITFEEDTVFVRCQAEVEQYPYAVFYVDGKKYDTVALNQGDAQWTLPEEITLEPESVIQVRVYDDTGTRIGTNFIDNRE
jgi:hypothetical protein